VQGGRIVKSAEDASPEELEKLAEELAKELHEIARNFKMTKEEEAFYRRLSLLLPEGLLKRIGKEEQ